MIESLVTIRFDYKRFDLETHDLIWLFEQITTFSNLGQEITFTLLVFLLQLSQTVNFDNITIPNLCRDIDSQARCTLMTFRA